MLYQTIQRFNVDDYQKYLGLTVKQSEKLYEGFQRIN